MNLDKWIEDEGRLPPSIARVLAPFFYKEFLGSYWNGRTWWPDWAKVRLTAKPSALSALGRGKPAPTWVIAATMYVAKTYLNRPGFQEHVACTLDLTTPSGMANVAHEVFHVYEWQTKGWWFRFSITIQSLFGWIGGNWHQQAREKRAMDFQSRVVRKLEENPDQLSQFSLSRPAGYRDG